MQSYYETYRYFPPSYHTDPYNYYTQPMTNYYQPMFMPSPPPIRPLPYLYNKRPPTILQAFMDEKGSFDFVKTAKTVDQMMKTVNQVVPLVKQFSTMFQATGK